MSSEKRPYKLKARGDAQQATRLRIVQATAELHQEVGPARTSVAEIARRAGVQRATVYTHFPDEVGLIEACQAHFMSQFPPPDLHAVVTETKSGDRIFPVLSQLYGWYEQTETGMATVLKDRGSVPALDEVARKALDEPHRQLAHLLAGQFELDGDSTGNLALFMGLALDFWTWYRFHHQGLSSDETARLFADAAQALAARTGNNDGENQ